jgi:hypothetical protein
LSLAQARLSHQQGAAGVLLHSANHLDQVALSHLPWRQCWQWPARERCQTNGAKALVSARRDLVNTIGRKTDVQRR